MASLEEQTYSLSTSLFVSVNGNVCSVSEDATDHQDGPAVPIVGVCTLAVSRGDGLAGLVPDSWCRLCQMCGVHPVSPLPNRSVSPCWIQLDCHHGEKAFFLCSHLRLGHLWGESAASCSSSCHRGAGGCHCGEFPVLVSPCPSGEPKTGLITPDVPPPPSAALFAKGTICI